ncbi:adenylate/guanylate cyclase domain-containing protein [Hydrogenophaga sp.]|uniref:adenylate/guanylate cyclase domain-containing protein n=1 Tax=Hydrogenophaga sp. TaxID=1904254 RepID=UPI0035685026
MPASSSPTFCAADNLNAGPEYPNDLPLQQHKVVLVMDLVESVRLMAADEARVVGHWHRFIQHASAQVLPAHGGRLVKSLGDGFLAEFDTPGSALQAALQLHRYFDTVNQSLPIDSQLHLRAGLNASHLYVDRHDVYGHGVNLAARVAGLANPGETVVTASVYDGMVDGVDGVVQDMGESFLKHWPEPVRTWLVSPVPTGQAGVPRVEREALTTDFRPSIAVIPFEARSTNPEQLVIGELIADGVIAQLSRSQNLRVISRLSTTVFRNRGSKPSQINTLLDAAFVLSGSYALLGESLVVMAELCDARSGEVVWAERLVGSTGDLLEAQSELLNTLASTCAQALMHSEVERTLTLPVPRLDSNALMLGGITLMHRSTPRDLQRSHQLLEAVIERHNRVAAPRAWLAKWYIMQVVQGQSDNPAKTFQRAIDGADRALDLEPQSSLALAIKGHALCHQGKDVDASHRALQEATQANPNDPMAWLYSSVWSTLWGKAEDSVGEAETALHLSPLDPQKYYFEMMLATSYAASQQWGRAADLCSSSLLKNRYHLPTIRCLMVCLYEQGLTADAQRVFQTLMTLQPDLTQATYLASSGQSPFRQRVAKVFAGLGLPLN